VEWSYCHSRKTEIWPVWRSIAIKPLSLHWRLIGICLSYMSDFNTGRCHNAGGGPLSNEPLVIILRYSYLERHHPISPICLPLQSRVHCMVSLHGVFAWCLCMVSLHGVFAWCLCMVSLHGVFAWCLCMAVVNVRLHSGGILFCRLNILEIVDS
jgi:hypothetical protein